ncbi:otu domain-containing protein ddb_g0284757 [Phtheirospermum japonicum]|uniref:Otu domain-containing protein ddb_g0284757 n=1 Tax=Phtheirospermum japonicum TaxID=374723 RepID=A0A830CQ63_9LAMI|nr:otu domain-containing protein ddb_g0284757 [Phtheirospermum japonicum]
MRNGAIFSNDGCSSSTSISSQPDLEDDKMIAVVLSEEYAKLDGTVGRRLSNLASVPHIPKVNLHFPSISDSNLDYQRLLQRLNVYGLYEVKVSGDGNCQFRALSDQIYRSPEYHKHVRKEIVKQLKDNHALYEAYVPMKFKHYHKKMAKWGPLNPSLILMYLQLLLHLLLNFAYVIVIFRSGEWGDHVTLQAAADKFAAKICLLTSFRDTCFIEIVPQHQVPARVAPLPHNQRKKHWLF